MVLTNKTVQARKQTTDIPNWPQTSKPNNAWQNGL